MIDEFKKAWKEAAPKVEMKTVSAPENVLPVCPHCQQELAEVWRKECPQSGIERYALLMCPHCRSVLGVLNQHPNFGL